MDEIQFQTFLLAQEASLAAIDQQLAPAPNATIADPTRTADLLSTDTALKSQINQSAHLLVEAYLVGSNAQRDAIRQMLNGLGAVRLHMGISPREVQSKIDSVRFRLALLIESMKDLGPDPEDAVDRIEHLCRAAKRAGIDRNPILREVAALSSSIDLYGVGSMRGHLLAKVAVHTGVRCRQCGNSYSEELPSCTHCGAPNSTYLHTHVYPIGEENDASAIESATDRYIFLPTLELFQYLGMLLLITAFLLVAYVLVLNFFFGSNFFQSWKGWTLAGIEVVLFASLRYIRVVQLFTRYSGKGRLALTKLQVCLILAIVFGGGAIAVIVAIFFSSWSRGN